MQMILIILTVAFIVGLYGFEALESHIEKKREERK